MKLLSLFKRTPRYIVEIAHDELYATCLNPDCPMDLEQIKLLDNGDEAAYHIAVYQVCPDGHGSECPHANLIADTTCIADYGLPTGRYSTPDDIGGSDYLRDVASGIWPGKVAA